MQQEITVDDLLKKIGILTVQNDRLSAEISALEEKVDDLENKKSPPKEGEK